MEKISPVPYGAVSRDSSQMEPLLYVRLSFSPKNSLSLQTVLKNLLCALRRAGSPDTMLFEILTFYGTKVVGYRFLEQEYRSGGSPREGRLSANLADPGTVTRFQIHHTNPRYDQTGMTQGAGSEEVTLTKAPR
ncbi:hypothetical protein AAFF_G00273180 [Aldrovandia affinis]|uniref:Uncharacterized protein n=1 Tax=Aldrovandia affinis TaxID=143900 RepID=A0AAD7SRV8_9TELE|nr:hypothetical protein AAFF_G00273180 [Aldrovandia affinis]